MKRPTRKTAAEVRAFERLCGFSDAVRIVAEAVLGTATVTGEAHLALLAGSRQSVPLVQTEHHLLHR